MMHRLRIPWKSVVGYVFFSILTLSLWPILRLSWFILFCMHSLISFFATISIWFRLKIIPILEQCTWIYGRMCLSTFSGSINRQGEMAKVQCWTRHQAKEGTGEIKIDETRNWTHLIRTHAMMLKQNMEYLMVDIWFSNLTMLAPWPSPFPAMSPMPWLSLSLPDSDPLVCSLVRARSYLCSTLSFNQTGSGCFVYFSLDPLFCCSYTL